MVGLATAASNSCDFPNSLVLPRPQAPLPAHQLQPASPGAAARLNPAEAERLRGFIDGAEVGSLQLTSAL